MKNSMMITSWFISANLVVMNHKKTKSRIKSLVTSMEMKFQRAKKMMSHRVKMKIHLKIKLKNKRKMAPMTTMMKKRLSTNGSRRSVKKKWKKSKS